MQHLIKELCIRIQRAVQWCECDLYSCSCSCGFVVYGYEKVSLPPTFHLEGIGLCTVQCTTLYNYLWKTARSSTNIIDGPFTCFSPRSPPQRAKTRTRARDIKEEDEDEEGEKTQVGETMTTNGGFKWRAEVRWWNLVEMWTSGSRTVMHTCSVLLMSWFVSYSDAAAAGVVVAVVQHRESMSHSAGRRIHKTEAVYSNSTFPLTLPACLPDGWRHLKIIE